MQSERAAMMEDWGVQLAVLGAACCVPTCLRSRRAMSDEPRAETPCVMLLHPNDGT